MRFSWQCSSPREEAGPRGLHPQTLAGSWKAREGSEHPWALRSLPRRPTNPRDAPEADQPPAPGVSVLDLFPKISPGVCESGVKASLNAWSFPLSLPPLKT